MAPISYQTITLSKGKHASPQDGACAMELASMLAGEPFNDHPQSVCPVIGSFLRAYNDRIDDGRRQDLYGYAAKVVGSRASLDVQHARAERLGVRGPLPPVATARGPCATPSTGPNPACRACRQPCGLCDPAAQRHHTRGSAGADRRVADDRRAQTADHALRAR